MKTDTSAPARLIGGNRPSLKRARRLVERNLIVYKHTWMVIFSGFFEPLFYLIAFGYGMGRFIEDIQVGPGVVIPYRAFIAPGLLAASCMNGAVSDGFFNVFFKLHFQRTYEGILATPLGVRDVAIGEVMWALTRGSLYAAGFLALMSLMGLVLSPWALLAFPAAIVVSATFSSMAIMFTSFAKKIGDFDIVLGLVVMPMFLFSTTLFPIEVYPAPIEIFVQATPLYHAISLLRHLTTGTVGASSLIHLAYLLGLMVVTLTIAMRRLERVIVK